ncbi:MAG: ArsR/SmtB family transcription factor [Candidatus Hodarchaeota archaeon]
MTEKTKEDIKTLIDCIGLDVDVHEYIKGLEKSRDEILSRKDFKENVISHKALGHESRFLIYNLIKKKEMCICELSTILDLTQPTISHHVKILEQAGLIEGVKSGKFIHYQIKKDLH